ncbi:hypothetical protein A2U01_0107539, partial [Trifolium medium]|nr:hypothetical protein [Trifolium medium]
RLQVPTRSRDEIRGPIEPIGKKFFQRAQTVAELAYAARVAAQAAAEVAAAPPPPPPPHHQQQHQ